MPNLDFNNCDTLYATHGLHAYAAKCPPQLVKYALRYYSKPGEVVLDPMVGSGTTLVESKLMGRHSIGYDIDPLAHLIAQVKSNKIRDEQIEIPYLTVVKRYTQDIAALQSTRVPSTVRDRATPLDFPNRDYWFDHEVATDLAILSYHISNTEMPKTISNFLWVAFSSLILAKTSIANARDIIHSRHHYYKHAEMPDVIGRFVTRVKSMRGQMATFYRLCQNAPLAVGAEARLGDSRKLRMLDESVDLIFTSPPYATALDYPRAHFLAVAWMQNALGENLSEYLNRASTYLGSERGRLTRKFELDKHLSEYKVTKSVITQLSTKSSRQANLTQRYFAGMSQVLSQMKRVLKPGRHAIIVVCPSHIRKVRIPTDEVIVEMAKTLGFRLQNRYTRSINERLRLLPYMKKEFGNRMSTEYVLILRNL